MSLVIAYNFDEGSGSTINDVSGNGHDLTLPSGGVPFRVTGKDTGGALGNDGTNNENQNWGIPASDWTNWIPRNSITLMCWVKLISAPNNYAPFVALGGATGYSGNFDIWYMYGNAVQIMMRTAASPSTNVQVVSSFTPDGLWHHWAATYDGTTLILYKDAVSQGSATANGPLGYPDVGYLIVAASPTSTGNNFGTLKLNGAVDDVRIYDTALTPAQIAYDMNRPVRPSVNGWTSSII